MTALASNSFSQTFSAQANMALGQGQSLNAKSASNNQDLRKAAEQFTGVFMSQMFGHMFEGMSTDKMFGGGQGEEMFRSVLTDEYGKAAAKQNVGGMTDKIMHALLSQQEVKS
ncbi:MAG TPA: rod-binding protein [Magnetospirillaceae bacterium]|nr:rod-binding protein [Magnetospirillaceae bacterium]